MRKIAISLSKGGTGKSTTAVNLAHGLSLQGYQVLLVDCDTQGQASFFLGVDSGPGLSSVLNGEEKPEDVIVQAREGLQLLRGGRRLAEASLSISKRQIGIERALSEALTPVEGKFDFVVLDMAPGWDILSVNVFFYVQELLCPVALEVAPVQSLGEFQKRIADIRAYNSDLGLKYIVPTFLDKRTRQSRDLLTQLQGHFGEIVSSPVRYNVRLSEAAGYGQTIFEYAPKSPGAEDYSKLVKCVLKHSREV